LTNRRRRGSLRPEEAATLQLSSTLPGLQRELQLANGSIADLADGLLIAEVEPLRRWQQGFAQLLEYWDQSLRSAHPVLIIIRDADPPNPKRDARLERLAASYAVRLWTWDAHRQGWTNGGPASRPTRPPAGPIYRPDGTIWQPDPQTLRAYRKRREPFQTWLKTYEARKDLS